MGLGQFLLLEETLAMLWRWLQDSLVFPYPCSWAGAGPCIASSPWLLGNLPAAPQQRWAGVSVPSKPLQNGLTPYTHYPTIYIRGGRKQRHPAGHHAAPIGTGLQSYEIHRGQDIYLMQH